MVVKDTEEVTGREGVAGTEGSAERVSTDSTSRTTRQEERMGEERRVASQLESADIGEKIGHRPRFS